MNIVGISISQWLPCLLVIWAIDLDGNFFQILLNHWLLNIMFCLSPILGCFLFPENLSRDYCTVLAPDAFSLAHQVSKVTLLCNYLFVLSWTTDESRIIIIYQRVMVYQNNIKFGMSSNYLPVNHYV